jgi:hypothetical protein
MSDPSHMHEHTARRLIAELRRRNDIDEMSLPVMWNLSDCSESMGITIDEVRRLAARALGYRPGRGHRWRVSVEQVRALRTAAVAEARR